MIRVDLNEAYRCQTFSGFLLWKHCSRAEPRRLGFYRVSLRRGYEDASPHAQCRFLLLRGLRYLSRVLPKYRTSEPTSFSCFSPRGRTTQKSLDGFRRTQLQHRNGATLRLLARLRLPATATLEIVLSALPLMHYASLFVMVMWHKIRHSLKRPWLLLALTD